MDDLTPPRERERTIGRAALERDLRARIEAQTLGNGWLIAGPQGMGKASLAYRLARGLLDPGALAPEGGLDMAAEARTFRLVAAGAHPDLFVAERRLDEKKQVHQSEITVDTIRDLTAFLNKTASFGGWRVAIVDAADDMNRQAANALLKSLEEPPPRATLLLVAHAPGRLLATIRSRCRRIVLKPLPDADIVSLLTGEGTLSQTDAERVARAAKGRPGRALALAAGDGAEALDLVDAFLAAAVSGEDVGAVASSLAGRQAAARWEIFRDYLLEALADAARSDAAGEGGAGPLAGRGAPALAAAHERLGVLIRRGEAVNLDRRDMILAMGRALRDGAHAA